MLKSSESLSVSASDVLDMPEVGRSPGRTRFRRKLKRFLLHPINLLSLLVLLLIVTAAVGQEVIAPYGYNDLEGRRLEGPSTEHYFGTDSLGRDQFSRVVFGARSAVIIGLGSMFIGVACAVLVGVVSGTLKGSVDLVLQRFVDAWLAFPGIVLLLTIIGVLGPSTWTLVISLGLALGIGSSRVIRGAVLTAAAQEFVFAARAQGASEVRVMMKHIIPTVMPTIIVLMSVSVGSAVLAEAGLSFLGLGVQPPRPSWGGMLSSDPQFLVIQPWLAVFPGLTITAMVFAFNMLGDGLRDLLDPRVQ